MRNTTHGDGEKIVIYTPYITRNGVRIPPPPGKKVWRFEVDASKARRG